MVVAQVYGNDATIAMAGASGNFQLNVYMPVIAYNLLQSIRLLADGINSFNEHCAIGIRPNLDKIADYLQNSLMLVTALNRHIGYENAAKIAKTAYQNDQSLKQAALALGLLDEAQFDAIVRPEQMIAPR